MKEKTINFGVGGTKEVKGEISNSSKSNSGNVKEIKAVSHVSVTMVLGCVDLTKDQFPEMMDEMPSHVTISSLVKAGSIKATIPLVV